VIVEKLGERRIDSCARWHDEPVLHGVPDEADSALAPRPFRRNVGRDCAYSRHTSVVTVARRQVLSDMTLDIGGRVLGDGALTRSR
jgi:hypothetical protein